MIQHLISLLQLRPHVTMEKKFNSKEKMEIFHQKQKANFYFSLITLIPSYIALISGFQAVAIPVLISLYIWFAFQMYHQYKPHLLYQRTKKKLTVRKVVWFPLRGKLQKFRLKMKELDVIEEEV